MKAKNNINHPRSLAILVCDDVINHGKNLGEALETHTQAKDIPAIDRGFIQTLSYGILRWYWQLEDELSPLLKKPLRNKERLVKYTLLAGIFQIKHLRTPDHAAVSDTVKCCQILGKSWAKNLVNACLRSYLRQDKELNDQTENVHFSHPTWMQEQLQQAWPSYVKDILNANNQTAPLCLRVNQQFCSVVDYLKLLSDNNIEATKDPYSPIGIRFKNSVPVSALPHFYDGWVSVQDTASQQILKFLDIHSEQRILDACAAPGGKTSLILENAPSDVSMHALDINANRNTKLNETLKRLKLNATIIAGDASNDQWWDNVLYQRILVDAPCSGLGIIRRHPDIKHLRQKAHLDELHQSQQNILKNCWQLLEKGGLLLYTTCSILPSENEQQIKYFLEHTSDAKVMPIQHPTALKQDYGYQTLPGISDMDGFYYCLLQKQTDLTA